MNVALITGSREGVDVDGERAIDAAFEWAQHVIVGDCPTGVDAYVTLRLTPDCVHIFTADWDRFKRGAGPERNGRMVKEAARLAEKGHRVVCFAFPSKSSKGTWDCLRQAARHGIRGRVVPL